MIKHIIWTSRIDIEDWKDFFEEEEVGLMKLIDEDERYRKAHEMNSDYLDDARINLDIELPGTILAIADMGLWNGRLPGYKGIGNNLRGIFYNNYDDMEFYCDAYNLKSTGWHHDGTNYIEYRLIPDGVDADKLKQAIYDGTHTREMIRRYTRSLRPYVAKVYGW